MTIKMNGHSVVFGRLVQTLEQITPNSSTLQDNQNELSQLVQKLGYSWVIWNWLQYSHVLMFQVGLFAFSSIPHRSSLRVACTLTCRVNLGGNPHPPSLLPPLVWWHKGKKMENIWSLHLRYMHCCFCLYQINFSGDLYEVIVTLVTCENQVFWF